ncbi:MAG: helix-turn-helix transcriptional regulator [Sphingobacteriales bacterium]|jgi:transcriptional regulator with XRE-family HTH domain|nr:helix-turn-helix transcriptional regulator [Sphingobacteriales bacterium]
MFIARNLKYLRNKFSKKQPELARLLNVTQSTYSSYENERMQPNIANIILLADYFSVTVDALLKQNMEVEGITSDEKKNTHQVNNELIDNHNRIIHTEFDWARMEQRLNELQNNIELQKQIIVAKDELIAALKNK